jgi:hypothetical protein
MRRGRRRPPEGPPAPLDTKTGRRKTLLTLRDEEPVKTTLSEDGREISYGTVSWPSDVWMASLRYE